MCPGEYPNSSNKNLYQDINVTFLYSESPNQKAVVVWVFYTTERRGVKKKKAKAHRQPES